jgi:hypothetical protein
MDEGTIKIEGMKFENFDRVWLHNGVTYVNEIVIDFAHHIKEYRLSDGKFHPQSRVFATKQECFDSINRPVQQGDKFLCIKDVYMNGVRRKIAYVKNEEYSCTQVHPDRYFALPSLIASCHEWRPDDESFYEHFRLIHIS